MKKRFEKTVLDYLDGEIESARLHKSETTITHHVRARRRFSDFLVLMNLFDLRLADLNPRIIAGYQQHLRRQGLCRNTTSYYLRGLRVLLARAMSCGRAPAELFCQVYTGVAPTRKRAVEDDIIRRLARLDIRRRMKARPRKPVERHIDRLIFSRDLFLFSFYTCGMPFVDIAHLTRANLVHDIIRYSRHKTHQQVEVGILPEIQRIIDKYHRPDARWLFPILPEELPAEEHARAYATALRLHNRHLNQLASLIGLDTGLSSYVSRHSWATTANRHSVSLPVISQALGHNSERTTRIYLQSLESSEVSKANRQLLACVLKSVSPANAPGGCSSSRG